MPSAFLMCPCPRAWLDEQSPDLEGDDSSGDLQLEHCQVLTCSPTHPQGPKSAGIWLQALVPMAPAQLSKPGEPRSSPCLAPWLELCCPLCQGQNKQSPAGHKAQRM